MINLDELKQLEAAATPGPWEYWRTKGGCAVISAGSDAYPRLIELSRKRINANADAEYIVALRNAAPELFARLAKLEAEFERLEKFIAAAACKLDSNDATGGLYVLRCALAGEPFLDEDQYYPPDDTPPSLDKYVTDGFGALWSTKCPNCGAPMQVIRPGDCRCSAECYIIDDRLPK